MRKVVPVISDQLSNHLNQNNQASRSHYVPQGNTNIPCAQNEHTTYEPYILDQSQLDPVAQTTIIHIILT